MSIVYQVWEDNRMPTGTKISLEVLSKDDDGIFPNERSWNSFLTSNFGDGLTGEPRKSIAISSNNTSTFSWCISAGASTWRWLPKTWNSPSNTTPCRPW